MLPSVARPNSSGGLKNRVNEVLQGAHEGDRLSYFVEVFIVVLIGLNVLALILDTVKSIHDLSPALYDHFDEIA